MNMLTTLGLSIESPLAVPGASNYRPESWPPPPDWPVVIDEQGKVISRWGDPVWRLDPWAKKAVTLNFGDGPVKKSTTPISSKNANLLRVITGWWLYGPYGARGYRSIKTRFDQMRRLFALCEEAGILASELNHYPRVCERIPSFLNTSRKTEFLTLMHELYASRDAVGFTLLDPSSLTRLAALFPAHHTAQTPYIPPRIWRYQVTRLRECLDDFLSHREQVEACYRFCFAAYEHNQRVSERTACVNAPPFCGHNRDLSGSETGLRFFGAFPDIAKRFGIFELLERWVGRGRNLQVNSLTSYLKLVSRAGLAYILNFSLMRVEEAWNLRAGCLDVEHDKSLGDIYLLRGQTTKTISDSDALWVTSPSVAVAVRAMEVISLFRSLHASHSEVSGLAGRYLNDSYHEPWSSLRNKGDHSLRPSIPPYSDLLAQYGKLFDLEHLRITNEDLKLARLATPTLPEEYQVGAVWPLAWHQLRRTGAVNMQVSGLVSVASLQYQLKHITRAMSLYYGQNHSRLRLEEKAHTLYVRTMYEALGSELQQLTSERFVSPHGDKRKAEIVRLISPEDAKKMIGLAKKGAIACRPIILGVCSSREPCPYGGIDNIAHCGGGDSEDAKPCPDVLYDSERLGVVDDLEHVLKERLATAQNESPLMESLMAQQRSVESFRRVLGSANGR
ncbi:hypothetical protein [Pseudomonas sp. DSV-1]|uniref:hypothetical protein n=1 Tax=Pseudomonas sp. DSV-1 TaxID=3112250 RepID=UPI002DBAF969|nr:hypothetical protein [Pseudomonas sp. DSV-1]MEC4240611.1 hypothetical protein [Pseudomonas sp. DSV-1]